MTDRVDINRLLVEMRSMKAQTQAFTRPGELAARDIAGNGVQPGVKVSPQNNVPSFGEVLEQAVNKVNNTQKSASALAQAYEQGTPGVDITDVMVASQKASVSFQSMVQVRNKLLDAYRDVMNMPM